MTIFKLSAAKTAFVEWSCFAQKWIKFHPQPCRFQKNFPGRNPRLLLTKMGKGKGRDGEGLKGSYL